MCCIICYNVYFGRLLHVLKWHHSKFAIDEKNVDNSFEVYLLYVSVNRKGAS